MFLDEALITVESGSGGNGCLSFRREKYVPRGGPDGGDGGRGGSVYLVARSDMTTLLDLSRRPQWRAENGRPGEGNQRSGRKGGDIVVPVPVGTVVRQVLEGESPREGLLLCDFVRHGQRFRAARGGKGGLGNKAFATSTNQAPREVEEGGPGEKRRLYLELKLIADVGLVGLPNAGKSTLLSSVSAARPKVAAYPFTTLAPHLGIVDLGDYRQMVFADLPGLIEGAHEGAGLGHEFLRHVERTRVLIHLVSVEGLSIEGMVRDYRIIEHEIASHGGGLDKKPRVVVASKLDILSPDEREGFVAEFRSALGRDVLPLSSATGLGVRELVSAASVALGS